MPQPRWHISPSCFFTPCSAEAIAIARHAYTMGDPSSKTQIKLSSLCVILPTIIQFDMNAHSADCVGECEGPDLASAAAYDLADSFFGKRARLSASWPAA